MFNKKLIFLMYFLTFVLILTSTNSYCFSFKTKSGVSADFATTVTWGGAWRVAHKDKKFLNDVNSDDGDRNFDKGDMINNKFSVIMDCEFKYKNYGIFLRPRAFYDFAYKGKNANDSLFTNNNIDIYGGPLSKKDEFMHETKELHKDRVEILDAYIYGEFNLGTHNLNIRIGKQVVSWGESIFLLNSISSAQSPIDATVAHTPGAELRDLFLPVGQIYVQYDVSNNLTLQTYYQFQFEETHLDEAGSYFSSLDYLYKAGRRYLLPVSLSKGLAASIDRSGIDYAKNSGQWGVALRYFAENLNATDFGIYYINYHEKLPEIIGKFSGGTLSPSLTKLGLKSWTQFAQLVMKLSPTNPLMKKFKILDLADRSSYEIKYPENVHLFGFSFGTTIGDTNVSGEVSYRWHYPVMITDPTNILKFSYKNACILQTQVSFIHILSQRFALLWDKGTIMGEVGFNTVNGIKGSKLFKDKSAWGGQLTFNMDYYNVLIPSLDLTIPIKYKFNPNGNSSVPGTFIEHSDSIGFGLDFKYLSSYSFGIDYTMFVGGAKHNALADRDYIGVNFKYTF